MSKTYRLFLSRAGSGPISRRFLSMIEMSWMWTEIQSLSVHDRDELDLDRNPVPFCPWSRWVGSGPKSRHLITQIRVDLPVDYLKWWFERILSGFGLRRLQLWRAGSSKHLLKHSSHHVMSLKLIEQPTFNDHSKIKLSDFKILIW